MEDWLSGPSCSLVLIPIAGDLVNRSRKIWKGLRDVRDRSARHDNRWRDMAIGGLVEQERAMVIVQHAGIDLDEVWGFWSGAGRRRS